MSETKWKWSMQVHKGNLAFQEIIVNLREFIVLSADTSQFPNAKSVHSISRLPCSPDSVTLIQIREAYRLPIS